MQLNKRESFVKKLLKKSSTFRQRSHNHRPSNATTTLHFELRKLSEDYSGESLHICGSLPELGNGSIELAPKMRLHSSDSSGALWTYDVVVPFQELEFSRKDIAMTFDGNPQGFFFTFNFVVKQIVGGRVMIERFEEIPKRGLTKSSLAEGDITSPSSSSSGSVRFLPNVNIPCVWNHFDAPPASTVVPKGLDLKSLKSPKAEEPIRAVDPITAELEVGRLKGKSSSLSEAPESPTLSTRSRSTTAHRAQSAYGPEALTQQMEERDRSASLWEDAVPSARTREKNSKRPPSKTQSPKFKWYKTFTGRDLKRAPKKQASDDSSLPGNLASDLFSDDSGRDHSVFSRIDIARPRSSASDSPRILMTTTFEQLSPSKRKQREAMEEVEEVENATFEKRRREEDQKIIQRQLEFANNCDHYRDEPSSAAVRSPIPQVMTENAPVETIVQAPIQTPVQSSSLEIPIQSSIATPSVIESHLADLSSEFRSPAIPYNAPQSSKSAESFNGEISEDVLLDRLGESVPLLASESGQLPDEDSFYDAVDHTPLIGSVDVSFPTEPAQPTQSTQTERSVDTEEPSHIGVDPVLFGKWHRIGLELKKSSEMEGVSNWLHNIKQNVADKTRDVVEAVMNVAAPSPSPVVRVPSSVVPAEYPDNEPVDLSASSHRTPNEIILLEEQERARRMSHGIDPVLSGRWRNIGLDMSKKVLPVGPFESIKATLSTAATTALEATKDAIDAVSNAVPAIEQPVIALDQLSAPVDQVASSPLVPSMQSVAASPSPVVIATNEVKRKSIFEEDAATHGVIHRKPSVDAAVDTKPEPVHSTIPTPVGYHKTRQDFMPIIHSTSQTASDQDTAASPSTARVMATATVTPSAIDKRMLAGLGMLLFAMILFYFMSTYFPESLLANVSPSSSSSSSLTVLPERELLPNNKL